MIGLVSRKAGSGSAGKKIAILMLCILSFGLVVPAKGLFDFGGAAASETKTIAVGPVQKTMVVMAPGLAKTEVAVYNAAQAAVFDCSFVKPVNSELQGSNGINLNQPANCFPDLAVSSRSLSQVQLAVQPLNQSVVEIKVVNKPLAISGPALKQAPLTQQVPVLPLVSFVLALGLSLSVRQVLRKSLRAIQRLSNPLSLQQLQVLRC